MKRIIFGLLILSVACFSPAWAQSKLVYSEVVTVENASVSELYNRANTWFESSYENVEEVLQLADTAKGQFEGKALIKYIPKVYTQSEETKGVIRYSIKVYVKAGRYKYELSNFFHNPDGIRYGKYSLGVITEEESCPNAKPEVQVWSDKVWLDLKKQIDSKTKVIITSLIAAMANPAEPDDTDTMGDDW